MLLKKNTIR